MEREKPSASLYKLGIEFLERVASHLISFLSAPLMVDREYKHIFQTHVSCIIMKLTIKIIMIRCKLHWKLHLFYIVPLLLLLLLPLLCSYCTTVHFFKTGRYLNAYLIFTCANIEFCKLRLISFEKVHPFSIDEIRVGDHIVGENWLCSKLMSKESKHPVVRRKEAHKYEGKKTTEGKESRRMVWLRWRKVKEDENEEREIKKLTNRKEQTGNGKSGKEVYIL